ncbi:hypothetical protein PH586_13720 [Pseudomonas sp. SA3-5]|uniref:Alpha/beta hydrolase n=1 Tax=Pseudomonas aestuarii TaxID=3018340 RepID=A0ABT4XGV3_9PSED|nr:hypothetical protein [Pseudomonas aestuarii]MDA7087446.1 hypothetical protein [Pseudomonas aestuarii]
MAGNLDHRAWARLHRLTPLAGSLNPADYRQQLLQVHQWHLSGAKDAVMPPSIARDFVAGLPEPARARLLVLPGFDHHCCWAWDWTELWLKVSAP